MTRKLRTYAAQNLAAARIILADLARYGGPGSLLDQWARNTLGDPDAAMPAPARPGGTIQALLEFGARRPTPMERAE